MYTGSYIRDEGSITIPENYDGSAFRENEYSPPPAESEEMAQTYSQAQYEEATNEQEREDTPVFKKSEGTGFFSSLLSKIPIKSLFGGGASKFLNFDGFKLGSEEILIIATALILLFSKEGDKLCAVVLLLLVFIN